MKIFRIVQNMIRNIGKNNSKKSPLPKNEASLSLFSEGVLRLLFSLYKKEKGLYTVDDVYKKESDD